jgi:hypothetical protein
MRIRSTYLSRWVCFLQEPFPVERKSILHDIDRLLGVLRPESSSMNGVVLSGVSLVKWILKRMLTWYRAADQPSPAGASTNG